MDETRFKEIVGKLAEKEVLHNSCSRCRSTQIKKGKTKFAILGETALRLEAPQDGAPAQEVPSVMICCNQCGFLFHHALGPLGIEPASMS